MTFDGRPGGAAGAWPWDMPRWLTDALTQNGSVRQILYDPSFSKQDNDTLWNFTGNFRVIGYIPSFPSTPRLRPTNINESLTITVVKQGLIEIPVVPTERVMWADANISEGENENDRTRNRYVGINGGWAGHQSPHVSRRIPLGGNLAMLDGHVEWRKFQKMRVVTTGGPTFWW
jgi:prepilin-type processing-associated H-X9-DG protein